MKNILIPFLFFCLSGYSQNITLNQDQIFNSDSIERTVSYGDTKPLQGFFIYTKSDNISKIQPFIQAGYGAIMLGALHDSTTGYYISLSSTGFTVYDDNLIHHPITYNNSDNVYTSPTDIPDIAYVKNLILMKNVSKNALPPTSPIGQAIFVHDATGGKCPAYSDGSKWRRFSDNSIIN